MRKISGSEEKEIVHALRTWPSAKKLTWESLRISLWQEQKEDTLPIWSRQSLSANDSIRISFSEAKKRVVRGRKTIHIRSEDPTHYEEKITELECALVELNIKYEKLLARHLQLCYAASLIEGGATLLQEPLPDNTRSQKG